MLLVKVIKERTIYLNKACMNAIETYMSSRKQDTLKKDSKNKPLFLSERKERISQRTVQEIVKNIWLLQV